MIFQTFNALLTMACLGLVAVTSVLFVQALGALFGAARSLPLAAVRPLIAVLTPAHNEEAGIEALVSSVRAQLADGDRLLVVADNCDDRTAELAERAGAEVVVRRDPGRRGKGYALDEGLRHLEKAPPEVVVFLDADCQISPGGVSKLARASAGTGAPVQCLNLMVVNPANGDQSRLAEFAWRIKNDFRANGYARLGLPSQLFGTGMAFPWACIAPRLFATGHVAEDIMVGLAMAKAGHAPRFFQDVMVVSHFPETRSGADQQKKRWMHGHLQLISTHVPPLMWHALRKRDGDTLALAVDLLVPPLVLLGLANASLFAVGAAWALLTGSSAPMIVAIVSCCLLAASLGGAWAVHGRDLIGTKELRELPAHLIRVVNATAGFVAGQRSIWIRADRRTH